MEAIQKYNDLYAKHLEVGRDVSKMKLWGECDKWEFEYLAEKHPQIAEFFLERRIGMLEADDWNNYLTEKESQKIMASMNPPAKWSVSEVKDACVTLGVTYEKEPYFNLYALATTMNMLMSDHRKSLTETFSDNSELVVFVYKQAVEKLEDADRPKFIREYFEDHLEDI